MSRSIEMLLAIVALATTIGGCTDQDGNVYLHFTNATDGPIAIDVLYPDTNLEFVLEAEVRPGTTSVTRSDVYPGNVCSDRGVLIARDTPGREIARRTGNICKGDTWVIGQAPTPSMSG